MTQPFPTNVTAAPLNSMPDAADDRGMPPLEPARQPLNRMSKGADFIQSAELRPSCMENCGWAPKIALLMALSLSAVGCNLIKGTLILPEKGIRTLFAIDQENGGPDPVELQSQLLRFADNSIKMFNLAIVRLQRRHDQRPIQKSNLLAVRIAATNDLLAIATGSNTYASLLDMAIFASLYRMNVENYWIPKFPGDEIKPFLSAAQEAEKEIWQIAAATLKKDQLEELRGTIKTWYEQHPGVRSLRDLDSLSFVSEFARMNRGNRYATTSVFNLLSIDPLAGLDPATRELANTRMVAERVLFLSRHMPALIRLETELLSIHTAEIPQIEKLLANTAQLSASADRFSQTAERLPAFISTEREQIVQALKMQQPGLTSLAAQTEKALNAGRLMSDASTATLKSFQEVLRQLEAAPQKTDAEPFRINDYRAAAAQITAAAKDLTALLQAFDQLLAPGKLDGLSSRLSPLTRQTEAGIKELVDYAFRQILLLGLTLIFFACGMALATVLVFRRLKKRA